MKTPSLFSTRAKDTAKGGAARRGLLASAAAVFSLAALVAPGQAEAGAIRSNAGFGAAAVPGNDDGSTDLVPLGFSVDFFGSSYDNVYVNNNGNITFDTSLSEYTPFDLTSTARVIVAPFFADVDTRVGPLVQYGTDTVDGHPAFGVNWPGVGCYSQIVTVMNYFQLVLIDRSDVGAGDFDIEFNYDQIQWEAGTASGGDSSCLGGSPARAGYSNGTGAPGTFFELPGSGVVGAFLDGNPETGLVNHLLNSAQSGRYVFQVRGGVPICGSDAECDDGLGCSADSCAPGDPGADGRGCLHQLVTAGNVCRGSVGDCDGTETCDGTSMACPADAGLPDGSACDDGSFCNGSDTCASNVCVHAGNPCGAGGCAVCDEDSHACSAAAADTPCDSDQDDCTTDVCDDSGTCLHDAIPLAQACRFAVIGGTATQEAKVRTRLGVDIDGDVCADRGDIGWSSFMEGSASWVLLGNSGTVAKVRPLAQMKDGDVVTGGGCLKGAQGTEILESGRSSICCADSPVDLPGAGSIDACGISPRLLLCTQSRSQYAVEKQRIEDLAATQTLGSLSCPAEAFCTISSTTARNVVDVDRISLPNDGTLTIDAQGDPDAVFVIRVARGIRAKLNVTVLLTGGAVPENVLFYAPSGNCDFGGQTAGAGTLFCPAGRVRMKVGSYWQGAALGGRGVDLGDNVRLVHVPFRGLEN